MSMSNSAEDDFGRYYPDDHPKMLALNEYWRRFRSGESILDISDLLESGGFSDRRELVSFMMRAGVPPRVMRNCIQTER